MLSHLVLNLTVFTSDSDWIRINNRFVTVILKICQLHPGGEFRLIEETGVPSTKPLKLCKSRWVIVTAILF
jgi:hypothetical protein